MEKDRIVYLPIEDLKTFKNHPFKVQDNEDMRKLIESIKEHGLINPVVVRPSEEGGYEIVSGHRRTHACKTLGLAKIPAIIRDFSDDQAIISMVDANLQRESMLPSEKAFAYRMKLEAMNRQGYRSDLTSVQVGPKSSAKDVSEGDSPSQVKRYVRLTYLVPELLELVDSKKLAMNPAVALSFLKPNEQRVTSDVINKNGKAPSIYQANKLKELSQQRLLNAGMIRLVLEEPKKEKPQKYLELPFDEIASFFNSNATLKDMHDGIIYALRVVSKEYRSRMSEELIHAIHEPHI